MPKRWTSKELARLVEQGGWALVSQTGSHMKFKHSVKKGIVVIPQHSKDMPQGTATSILRQAGLK
jgi:predicted RNA binding protein YcfA (HicA-like mRNA interferase family)